MSLVYYDGWLKNKRATPLVGPGAAAVEEFEHRGWLETLTPGRRLALLIATGIGLHNFGEGLAIGQSAAAGELEPRARPDHRLRPAQHDRGLRHRRPDVRRGRTAELGLPRADGPDRRRPDVPRHADRPGLGQPGARGRVLRGRRRLDPLRRACSSFEVCRRFAMPTLVGWMLLLGLLLGFGTDWVLVAAGAEPLTAYRRALRGRLLPRGRGLLRPPRRRWTGRRSASRSAATSRSCSSARARGGRSCAPPYPGDRLQLPIGARRVRRRRRRQLDRARARRRRRQALPGQAPHQDRPTRRSRRRCRRDAVRLRRRRRAHRSGRCRSASCRPTRSTRASRPSTGSSSCGTSSATAIVLAVLAVAR